MSDSVPNPIKTMTFPFDVTVDMQQSGMVGIKNAIITIHNGITTLVGPNGTGKTQLLRGLKKALTSHGNGKKIRYISAGRLGIMEFYRSNYDGQRSSPDFDRAEFGNKQSVTARHQNETISGDFATLSERTDILIKVQERLRKLFKRDIFIDWDNGNLRVFFSRVGEPKYYSSGREASGLLHIAAILAALYDDEVGCLLIDEPEVSLHPQLQSFLLNEMVKVAGPNTETRKKLLVISTHSTEFIEVNSVNKLASVVFCNEINERPIQIDPSIEEFKNKKINALLAKLSQEHKLALFCRTPLLVEGVSDEIICSAISRKLSLNLDAAGSHILPVTGKGQFAVVIKLFRLVGKSPALLADADAITDDLDIISSFTTQASANKIANEQGHKDASNFAKGVYNDFCKLITSKWDDIKADAEEHYYWINRDSSKDEQIAKRRSAFCCLFDYNEASIASLNNADEWSTMKIRLNSLLELLKSLGCFILKKGTIEAYYQHSSQLTVDEKPNIASFEAASFLDDTIEFVKASYSDIVEALEFCSDAKQINEAEGVRNLLLTIITPALASLTNDTTDADLFSYLRNVGVNKPLFKLTKHGEGRDLAIEVDLTTNTLEVAAFPLRIKKGENPIEIVNKALNLD
ncbi:MAG TPA: AAA family ATPase [Flavipsychrobacter sp.]|nr:AAA family ATPase [Flavipsychrobacter sp.]